MLLVALVVAAVLPVVAPVLSRPPVPVPTRLERVVAPAAPGSDGVAPPPPPPPPPVDLAPPELPRQFWGIVEITAHLVNKTEEYPPWRRRVEIFYDYPRRRSRARVLEGLDAGKAFLRRWDSRDEYMFRSAGPFPVCRRALLSEPMPPPALAGGVDRGEPNFSLLPPPPAGGDALGGHAVRRWRHDDFPARQTVAVDAVHNLPLSVTDEFFEEPRAGEPPELAYAGMDAAANAEMDAQPARAGAPGEWTPVMTYTWAVLNAGPPEAWNTEDVLAALPPAAAAAAAAAADAAGGGANATAAAALDALWAVPPPWSHRTCERHMGGWPYIHAFHHFLRV